MPATAQAPAEPLKTPTKSRTKGTVRPDILPARGTVLDIYDLLRIAKLNVIYYGNRLWWVQVQSWAYTAVTTLATSAALGVAWKQAGFTTLPKFLGLLAAVLVPLRAVFAFEARTKRLSGLWSGYLDVFHSVDQIARVVRADQWVTPKQRALLASAHERFESLERKDDPSPSGAVLDRLQQQVIEAIPVDDWWLPPDEITPLAEETVSVASEPEAVS